MTAPDISFVKIGTGVSKPFHISVLKWIDICVSGRSKAVTINQLRHQFTPFSFFAFTKDLHNFAVFVIYSNSMSFCLLPFPNDGKTSMILLSLLKKHGVHLSKQSSLLLSIFVCLLVIPFGFQAISGAKKFEGNGTSQKCITYMLQNKYHLYIYIYSYKKIRTIFHEIKITNHLYGNILS